MYDDSLEKSNVTPKTAGQAGGGGFTLQEVLWALVILGWVCSSVLVVINRCVASAAD